MGGSTGNSSTSEWRLFTVTGSSPSTAAKARLYAYVSLPDGTPAGEVHYLDEGWLVAGAVAVGTAPQISAGSMPAPGVIAGVGGVGNPLFPDRTVVVATVVGVGVLDAAFGVIQVPIGEILVLSNVCHGI
jgi:hypothetical protein